MFLLSGLHGGRGPTTGAGSETLEIMCNLIFAQNKRSQEDGQQRQHGNKGRAEEWTGVTDGPVLLKESQAFVSQATQSHRPVLDSTHFSDTCINGILAWDCRC